MIAIAHRLSTIAEADKVVVMEKGRIVEQGQLPGFIEDSRASCGNIIRCSLKESTFELGQSGRSHTND